MIWNACNGAEHIKPVAGSLYRLVESQEQVATAHLVDDLEEQLLLEQMLDEVKPPYPDNSTHLHYLLKTPFRYPPLDWGSRFGTRFEPSLFYGSTTEKVTLAESAYYRFVYLYAMETLPENPVLSGQHTLFQADYSSCAGIQLQHSPFNEFCTELMDKKNYQSCQNLGADMRVAGVEVFEYRSARAEQGLNVALFVPEAFSVTEPVLQLPILSRTTVERVQFKDQQASRVYTFELSDFLADGELPLPA